MPPTVVIVGRPNVGKSTLFNRLVGRSYAIVDATPGVTRDRREGAAHLGPLAFTVVDTAGYEEADPESLETSMRRQTAAAIAAADVVLFVIDVRSGVTPVDESFARWLRRRTKPVILVANKCEGKVGKSGLVEALGLGFSEPVAISAAHGEGLVDLYDALAPYVPDVVENKGDIESQSAERGEGPIKLAIVGRPNVGKSTLVNCMLGEERVVTSPIAGTTRDAVAIKWNYEGRAIELIDTAGLRRRGRVVDELEKMAAADAERAVDLAHVVVLVLDATVGLDKQDLTIAKRIFDEGRAFVVAVNKWDLIDERRKTRQPIADRLERSLPQARGAPLLTFSALTGAGTDRLLPTVLAAYGRWNKRVPTARLNSWLNGVEQRHPPPAIDGRPVRLRYITQAKTRPPTFVLFMSRQAELPGSYIHYLENELRGAFDLAGVPIRVHQRRGKNPFDKKER
ncbi:MAG: ribosome biogenesis GTPase Der [Alphaproteobacteria bacterium]|nr:ribosome biogenesis GTPase Der [Alphaproteobacteria bacterium]